MNQHSFHPKNSLGRAVLVTLTSGEVLEGVNSGDSTSTVLSLRLPTQVEGPIEGEKATPLEAQVDLDWALVSSCTYLDAGGAGGWATSASSSSVRLDTDISRQRKPRVEKALDSVPDAWLEGGTPGNSSIEGAGGAFDQFKVNETQFGVKSTYSEELYTTALDTSTMTSDELKRADKLVS